MNVQINEMNITITTKTQLNVQINEMNITITSKTQLNVQINEMNSTITWMHIKYENIFVIYWRQQTKTMYQQMLFYFKKKSRSCGQ